MSKIRYVLAHILGIVIILYAGLVLNIDFIWLLVIGLVLGIILGFLKPKEWLFKGAKGKGKREKSDAGN